MEGDKKLSVPFISRLIATHYSYEALVVAQAKLNPLALRQQRLQESIETLAARPTPEQKEAMLADAEAALNAQLFKDPHDKVALKPLEEQVAKIKPLVPRTEEDDERLDDLKDTLAQLSGLESDSATEVDKRLGRVDKIIGGRKPMLFDFRARPLGVTADQLYSNQKIADMVAKAETEQNDYRRNYKINPFFSPDKHHLYWGTKDLRPFGIEAPRLGLRKYETGITMSIYLRNGALLLLSSAILLVILWQVLRIQLKKTST
jgi:hypothetical protein